MSLFPQLDTGDVVILSAIGGALTTAAAWGWRLILKLIDRVTEFVVPRVDEHLNALKTSLATQAVKQVETEGHIGAIKQEIKEVHTTLKGHTIALEWLAKEQMRDLPDEEV